CSGAISSRIQITRRGVYLSRYGIFSPGADPNQRQGDNVYSLSGRCFKIPRSEESELIDTKRAIQTYKNFRKN
ncbi:MAG: hypothetical protein Q7J27_15065, partial [Syntrophales bacterium]|nr:hypothetical protein [Syntrophales bacterium]